MPEQLSVPSFAKINLSLHVIGKRSDGYHDIASVFQTIDLHDTIIVKRSGSDSFECNDARLPIGPLNLVIKSRDLFRSLTGIQDPVSITLSKRIPSPGGLGGGSSNAAATFSVLNRLFEAGLDAEKMKAHAAYIGADVPFFLTGGTAFCSGIGDRVESMPDWQPKALLLVSPEESVDTPWAYKSLSKRGLTKEKSESILKHYRLEAERLYSGSFKFENEFANTVFDRFSEVKRAFHLLDSVEGCRAGLSGSGPSIFAHCESVKKAMECELLLSESGYSRVFRVNTVSLEDYTRRVFAN